MIFFETAGQLKGFLRLLYGGAALGAAYDIFSLLRRHGPRWLGDLMDLIWCVLGALLCFGALAASGESRVRLYAFLGLLLGGGLYALGIRRVIRGTAEIVKKRMLFLCGQENAAVPANSFSEDKEA